MTAPSPGTAVTTTMNGGVSLTRATTMPAVVNAGDLLIVYAAAGSSAGASTWGTTPAGWSKPLDRTDTTSDRAAIFWKIAAGTEGGTTVNFLTTSATGAYAAVAFAVAAGTWSGVLADIVISTVATNQNPPNCPSLTSGYGSVDTLWFAFATASTNVAATAPTGYSGLATARSGTTTLAPQVSVAWKQTTAASEDPPAFGSWSTSTNQEWTISIKPASATNKGSLTDGGACTNGGNLTRGKLTG